MITVRHVVFPIIVGIICLNALNHILEIKFENNAIPHFISFLPGQKFILELRYKIMYSIGKITPQPIYETLGFTSCPYLFIFPSGTILPML